MTMHRVRAVETSQESLQLPLLEPKIFKEPTVDTAILDVDVRLLVVILHRLHAVLGRDEFEQQHTRRARLGESAAQSACLRAIDAASLLALREAEPRHREEACAVHWSSLELRNAGPGQVMHVRHPRQMQGRSCALVELGEREHVVKRGEQRRGEQAGSDGGAAAEEDAALHWARTAQRAPDGQPAYDCQRASGADDSP
eukprot:CAMPEP_0119377944 /NCGR_PEP_ID=MMETSP1334-20130426/47307_1 /TAXON_ID=127549 /ORGANISM="Calcidiscus leptoporus, Strain RCC1130" /LENGTH=198 /DNA_ID=CAMNT_0007397021 /DNA_START=184 /DNA_END=778 /DNA_ORIENTATION=-